MEKVLVFGINGFTGKHLQEYITKQRLLDDYFFVGVDRHIDQVMEIEYLEEDLLEPGKIWQIIKTQSPDYILNLVGLFGFLDFDTLLNTNSGISQRILDAVLKCELRVKKILLIGSAAEYGRPDVLPVTENSETNPVNLYGLTKLVQTQYALFYNRSFGMKVNVARPFNILGKNLSPSLSIGSFVEQIRVARDGNEILVGNLYTKRDFVDIEDVVDAYWRILLQGKVGEIYNVCSGELFCVNQILSCLIEKSKKSLQIRVEKERIRENDISEMYGDNSKLKSDTGWIPRIRVSDSLNRLL